MDRIAPVPTLRENSFEIYTHIYINYWEDKRKLIKESIFLVPINHFKCYVQYITIRCLQQFNKKPKFLIRSFMISIFVLDVKFSKFSMNFSNQFVNVILSFDKRLSSHTNLWASSKNFRFSVEFLPSGKIDLKGFIHFHTELFFCEPRVFILFAEIFSFLTSVLYDAIRNMFSWIDSNCKLM